MDQQEPPAREDADFQWSVVERWQEFEGESRANLLRVLGIAAFYLVELVNYHGLNLGFLEMPKVAGVDRGFHLAVTALAGAWAVTGWGVLTLLRARVFPTALKFASTGLDLAFLTAILLIADGPQSPLLAVYFLVILLSALRFNLPLVRFATAGAILSYTVLLGNAAWFRIALRVPRYHQVTFILALTLAGIVLAQLIARIQRAAHDYAVRLGAGEGKS